MEQKGIKEIKELIEGLAVVQQVGKEIMADGKVDFSDTMVVLKYKDSLSVLIAAGQGVGEIGAEIKDLSGEEAIELIQLLVAKLKAA